MLYDAPNSRKTRKRRTMPKKLSPSKIDEIRGLYYHGDMTIHEIAVKTKTAEETVYKYTMNRGKSRMGREEQVIDKPDIRLSDEYILQVADRISKHSRGYPEIASALHELIQLRANAGSSITPTTGDAKQWLSPKDTYTLHLKPQSKARSTSV